MNELPYYPGLEGVVAGETSISAIEDGLRYRGYSIEELAEYGTFEEIAYLILHDELPTADAEQAFRQRLTDAASLPREVIQLAGGIPVATSLMDALRSATSLLAHWDAEVNVGHVDANLRKAERLLAQLPVILAAIYRMRRNEDPVEARGDYSFAQNLLWMLRGQEPTEDEVRAMDISLILYAEHEFNASTFTARVIASTLSDLHSAIVGAIGALKGPLHGGANERVMDVLQKVGTPENAEKWVEDALEAKQRIMGFGHRVYKHGDPRAAFLKPWCKRLAATTGDDSLEKIADVIEQRVHEAKRLPPNLDWPSARLYHYMQLPIELYTPLFVISRVVGWSAHVVEQQNHNRIIRPRSRYIGPSARGWVPLSDR